RGGAGGEQAVGQTRGDHLEVRGGGAALRRDHLAVAADLGRTDEVHGTVARQRDQLLPGNGRRRRVGRGDGFHQVIAKADGNRERARVVGDDVAAEDPGQRDAADV